MSLSRTKHALALSTPAQEAAAGVVRRLQAAGYEAYFVGGVVRDHLLGRAGGDVDVATSATPEEVQTVFDHTVAVGEAFGVIVVVCGDEQIEVATFRTDLGYSDGRRPDGVAFCSAAEDAARRDFTVNALFYDLENEEILDWTGGLKDLRRGVLRAIGEPSRRFDEDHLRMVRAVRFAAQLGFELDPATAAAVRAHAADVRDVSRERVFAEVGRMLTGRRPAVAMRLLRDLGLLAVLLPDVDAMAGVAQPPRFHPEGDVWTHTLLLLEGMAGAGATLAWSVLLHDIGKPPTFARGADGRIRFPNHASTGAQAAGRVLRSLRAPNRLVEDVQAVIRWHMSFADVQEMKPSTRRRMLARPTFAVELELHRLDCCASHGRLANYVYLLDCITALRDQPPVPAPLVTGRDVLACGVGEGPAVGRLLRAAQDLQLEGRLQTREQALAWLRQAAEDDGHV